MGVVYNPIQQLPVVYNSSQQLCVVYNPIQQVPVVYNPSSSCSWCSAPAGDVEKALGEKEKEERLRKVRSIPWLEYSSPCSSSQDTWQLTGRAVYIVPSHEI